eukprot:m.40553 g.40553  ORF g.40553 m.40553 type:complete len:1174 (+) comp32982_c0_seq3:133-3654(+)
MAEQPVARPLTFRRLISIVDEATSGDDFENLKKYLSNPNSLASLVADEVQLADDLVEEISRAERSRHIFDSLQDKGVLDGSTGSKQILHDVFKNAHCSDQLLEALEKAEYDPSRSSSTVINVTGKKSRLPISISDLLHLQGIEESSLQCYPIWSSGSDSSTVIKVVQTICAFANDISDDSSGYVVIGVDHTPPSCRGGHCHVKIHGVQAVGSIEKGIVDLCHYLKPKYIPIFSVEEIEKKQVLAIHVSAGEGRPYVAPRRLPGIDFKSEHDSSLFIRQGTHTVVPSHEEQQELYVRCSRVSFDQQKATVHGVSVDDIDIDCVCRHLEISNPNIVIEEARKSPLTVYQQLDIVAKTNGDYVPRNVGLLVFSRNPEKYVKGATMRIVTYDVNNTLIKEQFISGPVREQIRECLDRLVHRTAARPTRSCLPEAAEDFVSYPYPALKETIVNAVYHRGYGENYPTPTHVLLYSDRLEIISCPGPSPKFKIQDFQSGAPLRRYPRRNPKLGSFLRDMKMAEEASTGIPMVFASMKKNESPKPKYEFDEQVFRVVLPAHPQHKVKMALDEVDYCMSQGNATGARRILSQFNSERPGNGEVVAKLLEFETSQEHQKAIFQNFFALQSRRYVSVAVEALKMASTDANVDCTSFLASLGVQERGDTSFDDEQKELRKACRLVEEKSRSAEDQKAANEIFSQYDEGRIRHNAKYCLCFGLVKMRLAEYNKGSSTFGAYRKLVIEAEELLRRVLQMHHASDKQLALAHQGIGFCLAWASLATEEECKYHQDRASEFDPSLGSRKRIRTTSRNPRSQEMPILTAATLQETLKQLLLKTSGADVQTVVDFVLEHWKVPKQDGPKRLSDTAATLIDYVLRDERMDVIVLICKYLFNPSHSLSGESQPIAIEKLHLEFQRVFVSSLAAKHQPLKAGHSRPDRFDSWLTLNYFIAKLCPLCPLNDEGMKMTILVLSGIRDLISDKDLLSDQRLKALHYASKMFQCCGEHLEKAWPSEFSKILDTWQKLTDDGKVSNKVKRLVRAVIVLKQSGWSTEAHEMLDQQLQKKLSPKVETDLGNGKEDFIPIPEFNLTSPRLQRVAGNIGKERKKVARELGISDNDVENNEFVHRGEDLTELAYQGLQLWKKRKGRDATVASLHKALASLELEAAIDTLKNMPLNDEAAPSSKQ